MHRLQWLRAEHPDALVTTHLEQVDFEAGWAIFHARAEIPGHGVAEGTGSETRQAFLAGWLEKAETVAIGRALAALAYGTAFCLDFDTIDDTSNSHLADAPVLAAVTKPNGNGHPTSPSANGNLATPAQLKLIYLVGTRDTHLTEEELEETCQAQYGRLPIHLTKREASEFIDSLKTNGTARAK